MLRLTLLQKYSVQFVYLGVNRHFFSCIKLLHWNLVKFVPWIEILLAQKFNEMLLLWFFFNFQSDILSWVPTWCPLPISESKTFCSRQHIRWKKVWLRSWYWNVINEKMEKVFLHTHISLLKLIHFRNHRLDFKTFNRKHFVELNPKKMCFFVIPNLNAQEIPKLAFTFE